MSDGSGREEDNERPEVTLPFHKRFNIEIDLEEAEKRFINRLFNGIDVEFGDLTKKDDYPYTYANCMRHVASRLGIRYEGNNTLAYYAGKSYGQHLRAVEALYSAFVEYRDVSARILNKVVRAAISESEVDLGIEWKGGVFWPSGAKLLDEELVSEPMRWLDDPKYKNVLEPFQKGLKYYMEAANDASRLRDTITDMYEALEKMARIVNGNDKNLSANTPSFVSNLGLSEHYANMLREYCRYAHAYRHAAKQATERLPPNPHEVEAFLYTTGLFIRLAVQRLDEK